MCGIAGYLSRDGECDPATLREMCDALAHRGPDDAGYYVAGGIALGHRRLSIIDLSTGHQPISNETGSLLVIFNGEIYNYLDLRSDLVRRGHEFTTSSDTEVLVHLYEDVGERLPEYLNGMFALAIWDRSRRELFLARDRYGEKPMYYAADGPGFRFAFASELKGLLPLYNQRPNVNPKALADFLALSYIPDPDTIFSGIRKLEAGHSLLVTAQHERIRRYFEPSYEMRFKSFEKTAEEVRALAADSVERRMVSDVPIGAFLSGGVDSSAAVAFMSRLSRVKTFSIGFTTKEFDELEFARLTAEKFNTEHREQVVTPEIGEVLDTLVNHYDEPFGDSSAIPTLYLARMTRQHVTVALSGDGADELFGGYRRYFYGIIEQRLRGKFPQWFRQTAVRTMGRFYPKFDYLPQVFRAKTLLMNLSTSLADAYFTSMSTFRDGLLSSTLSDEFRRSLGGYDPRQTFRARFSEVSELSPIEQMQVVDQRTWLPGDILVKTDRATMAFSLESRAPWLDHRLWETFFRVPSAWKVQGVSGKLLFKRAVAQDVPAQILTRKKMGFAVPLANWFRTSLRTVFESALFSEAMEQYLNVGEVRRLWQEHQTGLHNHDRKLWNLLMFAQWHRRFCESETLEPVLQSGRGIR